MIKADGAEQERHQGRGVDSEADVQRDAAVEFYPGRDIVGAPDVYSAGATPELRKLSASYLVCFAEMKQRNQR